MRNAKGQFVKGTSGFTGKHSVETKLKIGLASIGRKPTHKQLEALKKGGEKKWTQEMRKKSSLSHTGMKKPWAGQYLYKGDEVGYYALHHWVIRALGRAKKCQSCGVISGKAKDGRNTIDWANKSRHYRRVADDWIPLCRKCHKVYDRKKDK